MGLRARLAVTLVLLYAAASNVEWWRRAAWTFRPAPPDEISLYELRFEALRSALPSSGMVGYLGSPEPTGPTPREANAAALLHFRRYLLAQYVLAPLLVVESTEPDVVVGNFEPGSIPPPPPGFRLVRDFGDGVVLFERSRS